MSARAGAVASSRDRLLHRDATATSLAIARIAVFSMWAFRIASDDLLQPLRLPALALEPIGVLQLLPSWALAALLTPTALLALKGVLFAGTVALTVGLGRFAVFAPVVALLLVVEQSVVRSVGSVTHGEVPMLCTALLLAAFPCNDALALTPSRAPRHDPALYRTALVGGGLILCLTYALTAVRRLDESGLTIYLDGTILYRVALRAAERDGLGLIAIERPWIGRLLTLGFPVVTLFELLSPLALFHRGFRWLWMAVLVTFHLSVSVLMSISFRANLVLMAVFLTELPQLLAGLWAAKRRRT